MSEEGSDVVVEDVLVAQRVKPKRFVPVIDGDDIHLVEKEGNDVDRHNCYRQPEVYDSDEDLPAETTNFILPPTPTENAPVVEEDLLVPQLRKTDNCQVNFGYSFEVKPPSFSAKIDADSAGDGVIVAQKVPERKVINRKVETYESVDEEPFRMDAVAASGGVQTPTDEKFEVVQEEIFVPELKIRDKNTVNFDGHLEVERGENNEVVSEDVVVATRRVRPPRLVPVIEGGEIRLVPRTDNDVGDIMTYAPPVVAYESDDDVETAGAGNVQFERGISTASSDDQPSIHEEVLVPEIRVRRPDPNIMIQLEQLDSSNVKIKNNPGFEAGSDVQVHGPKPLTAPDVVVSGTLDTPKESSSTSVTPDASPRSKSKSKGIFGFFKGKSKSKEKDKPVDDKQPNAPPTPEKSPKISAETPKKGKTNIRIFEIMASSPSNGHQSSADGSGGGDGGASGGVGGGISISANTDLSAQSPDKAIDVKVRNENTNEKVSKNVVNVERTGILEAVGIPDRNVGAPERTAPKGLGVGVTSPSVRGGLEVSGNVGAKVEVRPKSDRGISDGYASSPGTQTLPSSSTSGLNPPTEGTHMVVVAIDFGTAFSGYAFSFVHDKTDSVHMMGRWEGGDPGVINQKTPTTLLLTPDEKFHSFGFTARNSYHDLTPDEAKKWLYFDNFKMALYHQADCSKQTAIEAANGRSFSALQVVALTLAFFKDHALTELTDQCGTRILNEDVRWVVTVPAIWNAQAKQFMRIAAYEAGLASSGNPDQLLISLEPEAASVHIRRLRMHQLVPDKPVKRPLSARQDSYYKTLDMNQVSSRFKNGDRYMVVDCGGGTVDVTVHELDSKNGRLQELHKATGGPHGSCGIDREFEKLLADIFGEKFVRTFRVQRPAGWVGLMMAFESRKRATSPFKTTTLNIPLPFAFIDYHSKTKNESVESAIKAYGTQEVTWSSQGMLRLTQDAMKRLFQPTLDAIHHVIRDVLANVRDIHYIFLVGGLSESPLLQTHIRGEFANHGAGIIVPQEASLAVLKGAVSYGLDPSVVCLRRAKFTYGAAVLNRFVRGRHPESKLIRKDGADWCRDVFDRFVLADQLVKPGETVSRTYAPATIAQQYIAVGIYSSESPDVEFTTDPGVSKCAKISLDLTALSALELKPGQRRTVRMSMTFGDTEIKITAVDIITGQSVNATIDFINI